MECGDGYEACPGCRPGSESSEKVDAEQVRELVSEIEDLIFLENGGEKTNWSLYPFEYYKLFCEWRDSEKAIQIFHNRQLQETIKSLLRVRAPLAKIAQVY